MDQQPPPFFKRGPAPLARLSFYAALSTALLFVDARFQTLELLRSTLSLITYPLHVAAHAPIELLSNGGQYLTGITRFQEENSKLKRDQLESASALLRLRQLESENTHLRKLLDMRERQHVDGIVARIVYAARDPFSRRIVVDKGQQHRIEAGQPVIDEAGVVGQVTRIFPFVSEIALITDKEQSVPVQIVRNGLRSVVFGLGSGQLELRFMPANADVQNGDVLVTSGLDGIFPVGLPVARITHIERDTSYSFARIFCEPTAGVENYNEVMVLAKRQPEAIPEEALTSKVKTVAKPGQKKKRLKRD
ncbi:rod shape-determining protein MreC [Propionivibrio dicarboxylicus]|uniref:Cell shape-determining protein MreC n=1 Tax=Propionivibrio dicarboxylicus TaxID=83767 RepID=A0A1G7VY73_9RHOO|nr:rod shape-determining protein MreC [Propionivibrio dicarboxylicus]SDG64726.1 rod shape-determining protein MreC [Propionivibrio dicarboxylicus]